MKTRLLILLFFLLTATCISQTASNDPKFFSATFQNCEISIPQGFEQHNSQQAYIHRGSASTLLLTALPGVAFDYADEHFSNENFEKGNARIISQQKVKTADQKDAILYTLSLTIADKENKPIEYQRLILVTGDAHTTLFVVANYPLLVKKIIEEPLMTCLLSVTLKAK